MKSVSRGLWLFVVTALLITGCDGDSSEGGGMDVFTEPVNPAFVKEVWTTCENDDGTTEECLYNIPLDQLGVMMETGHEWQRNYDSLLEVLDTLAAEGIEAEIVGQVPSINLFQVHVHQDDLRDDPENATVVTEAFERLRRAGDVIRDSDDVDSVSFNWPMEVRDGMEPDDDNADTSQVRSAQRPGLAGIDYYQAVPIYDEVFGSRSDLSQVMVGILDTGLAVGTDQFEQIYVNYVDDGVATDPDGHGTAVTGLLAADNRDGATNGIASRILNGPRGDVASNHLSIMIGRTNTTVFSHIDALRTMANMAVFRPQIINLSMGYNRLNIQVMDAGRLFPRIPTSREFADARRQWVHFMSGEIVEAPDADEILYVAAVPNFPITLTTGNDFPSGVALSNVISVGGLDSEDLFSRPESSASGPQITVAAPSTNIPVLDPPSSGSGVGVRLASGTSYATAMITSMAAIMFAVDDSATPAQIKAWFSDEDNTYPADPSTGRRRATLLKTVGRYVLAHGAYRSSASFMDHFAGQNSNPDPAGLIMNNHIVNHESTLTITDDAGSAVVDQIYTSAEYDEATGRFVNNSGGILASGLTSIGFRSGEYITGAATNLGPFELGSKTIGVGGDASGTLSIGLDEMALEYRGDFISGSLTFDQCEISSRSIPLDLDFMAMAEVDGEDAWKFIQVSGNYYGRVRGTDFTEDPPVTPVFYDVEADFDTVFALFNIDETTEDYLERNCIGGFHYDE